MSAASDIRSLLAEYDQTFTQAAAITLKDSPSPLFRLLVLTSLLSANLDPRLGLRTAKAFGSAKLNTAKAMTEAGQRGRWQVLSDSKYLRKEQTAKQLGALADEARDRYDGDLRGLRDDADGDPVAMHDAVQRFTGIGALGADIFLREVQTVWPELQPFADDRVLKLAKRRGLPDAAAGLARSAGTKDLAHLGAALVFADMADRR